MVMRLVVVSLVGLAVASATGCTASSPPAPAEASRVTPPPVLTARAQCALPGTPFTDKAIFAADIVAPEEARRLFIHQRGPGPQGVVAVGERIAQLQGRLVKCDYRAGATVGGGRWVVLRGSVTGFLLLDTNLSL
jgi:hypothetical protein